MLTMKDVLQSPPPDAHADETDDNSQVEKSEFRAKSYM